MRDPLRVEIGEVHARNGGIVEVGDAVPLRGVGPVEDRAIVSAGGVALTEVDWKTMQSKIAPNIYLTGDVLDINRPSGGYSLQICWTTGFVAGNAV